MHTSFDRPFTNRRYLEAVADHVVVFDGATGTELAKTGLLPEDFGSESAMGLMEMLVLYRPDVVTAAHTAYLEAGADVIETDTFRGNRITLQEFGVADFVLEINTGAAALARRVADRFATQTGQPRFVAGAIGPTGQLPSLAAPHAATMFDQLVDVFAEQASGLLAGGVDLLLLETQQDLLALKAAILGIWTAFTDAGVRIPIQAQVTLDPSGRMLTGPNIEAAVATLAALPVDVIGLNCSTGPEEMRDSVRKLLAMTNRPVSVLPNAGMPENVGGRALYRLAPEVFARTMAEFVRWGVRIVGGCCGTGPEHIQALRACISNQESPVAFPVVDYPRALPWLTSSVQAVALHQEPRPLLVGERINTQGSRKARQLVLEERYEALLDLAETQTESGAHVLDVCLALTERDDEEVALRHVVRLLSQNASAPLMIDTTSLEAMRAVLQVSPGRLIINSVNLEAGEAHAREVLDLARTFGAALVALTIDEQGMAKSCQRKLDIARRLYRLAVEDTGLPPHALIFDPLTFTLATGDAASANAAMETLNALRAIKTELPGVLTNLGVSNVSYGLHPAARRVLNSVFLYRAVEAGLDLAIVNPAQIVPFPEIPPDLRALADDVIFNRSSEALARFLAYFEAGSFPESEARQLPERAPAEQLFDAILYRRREGVEAIVDACLSEQAPLSILNKVLLPAMKEVGERFGRGELILPFVLRSAEVMQAAVAHLEPHLERSEGMSRGTVVLATVYGDVHDIGKNLVKTILVNNGYTVHDLGKQVPVGTVIDQALALHADAIGLSALLVATSRQMQIAVAELHRRSLRIPVLVGGAAINPSFARRIAVTTGGDLYPGGVFYCKDAFEALQVLEHIVMYQPQVSEAHHHHEPVSRGPALQEPASALANASGCAACGGCGIEPAAAPAVPAPPFWGTRGVSQIPLEALWPLLDRKSLFRVGWGAKGATGAPWEALQAEFAARLAAMWPATAAYLKPQAVYGYFPAHSDSNDLVIYDPEQLSTRRELARFSFPRQSRSPCRCIADYFAPVGAAVLDVVALQIVTVGPGATRYYADLEAGGAYTEAYFVHGLAAQITEAAAAWMHRQIRRELGLTGEMGKRYSWGYPSCPDLAGHETLFALLPAGAALSMSLSPAGQLIPEHSTAAIVVHHPDAVYFAV